jgi:hypothetical protein
MTYKFCFPQEGHKKKEIWSPAFQPVVVVKPLFPEHLVKLIRGDQAVKTVKRRRKQSNRYMQAIHVIIVIFLYSFSLMIVLYQRMWQFHIFHLVKSLKTMA